MIGSKVKLDKMLQKQMKSMSIGSTAATKNRKINIEDSESESDEDE